MARDILKGAIAEAAFEFFKMGKSLDDEGPVSYDIIYESNLLIQLRVKTARGSYRYFTVQVKENI